MSPLPPCVTPPPPTPPVNKRLDEWVTPERLDLQRVQGPRKEAKTPTKNGLPGSRPDSPERDPKRKVEVVSPATPVPAATETSQASVFPQVSPPPTPPVPPVTPESHQ
ncbi:histone acetyltransferase KAT5-like [Phasianus colchicus]|uniref:histone acetyltransferase KAT5-like n=1 Tax=Phasianus colchicus TaxID=9054 RepID=UPI00129D2903|nr:histone acetyltransferase KAT5-like [Phasianus colchicus]